MKNAFFTAECEILFANKLYLFKHHSLIIDKGIHEKPLIYELLPLGLLVSQVSVVVVGDDNAV